MRCRAASLSLALLLALAPCVAAHATRVPLALDMRADAAEAQRRGIPLLVVVTQTECEYCVLLMQEVLEPMMLGAGAAERVMMRELIIDLARMVRDFDGSLVDPADLARRYRAAVTPTLLFLDPAGRELAPRMVGVNTVEFYGWYLDQSIERARASLAASSGAGQKGND